MDVAALWGLCAHGSRENLAAVNAVAIDETGSVLQPASTSVETGDPTYADNASRQWARP
jgi:hypothetical protein